MDVSSFITILYVICCVFNLLYFKRALKIIFDKCPSEHHNYVLLTLTGPPLTVYALYRMISLHFKLRHIERELMKALVEDLKKAGVEIRD